MREVSPEIDQLGARVVAVVCQKRTRVESYLARNPCAFPIVTDEDRTIARAWGVYHRLGLDAVHIAHPATFVVDGAGIIRFAHVAPDQVHRAGLEEVLAVLRASAGSS